MIPQDALHSYKNKQASKQWLVLAGLALVYRGRGITKAKCLMEPLICAYTKEALRLEEVQKSKASSFKVLAIGIFK